MARLHVPTHLRELAGGVDQIEVEARTVAQLLRELAQRHPALHAHLRRGMAVAIDGEIIQSPLLEPIGEDSEIHFLPAIRGG